jgi:hypothetical protein
MFSRTDSSEICGLRGSLLTASVAGPRAARSRRAKAKFLVGMYEGRVPPLVSALGRLVGLPGVYLAEKGRK